jgi:hypothetical protein
VKCALVSKIGKAHAGFLTAFRSGLERAKEAGECLHELKTLTGKPWNGVYALVREFGIDVSDTTLFKYKAIAERWNGLKLVAGKELSESSIDRALGYLSLNEKFSETKTGDTPHQKAEGGQSYDETKDSSTPSSESNADQPDLADALQMIARKLKSLKVTPDADIPAALAKLKIVAAALADLRGQLEAKLSRQQVA